MDPTLYSDPHVVPTFIGVASWSSVRIDITTWDFDGIGAIFRPLTEGGGQWRMGGGGPPYTPDPIDPTLKYSSDPKIMDDHPVITIP